MINYFSKYVFVQLVKLLVKYLTIIIYYSIVTMCIQMYTPGSRGYRYVYCSLVITLLVFYRKFTVNEVVSMLEDDDSFQRADIHILPPTVAELTDEDSGSENEDVSVDNLPGRQLDQPATVTVIRPEGRQVINRTVDSDVSKILLL